MGYLWVALRKNWFLNSLVESTFKKHNENAKCFDFQFHNRKFGQKGIFNFDVTTVTDMFMKEVIDSSLCRAFWMEIMEKLKALTLSIVLLNLVRKGLSFYYNVIFTGLSMT